MELRAKMEQLNTCICKMTELYRTWAKRHGMSYNTMMALYALGQSRKCTQKQIADEWLIPKQTVNTVIKELERLGYISFEPLPGSKQKVVCLTESGRAYADSCLHELYEIESSALRSLGQPLTDIFIECNLAFVERLDEEVRGHAGK
ncbi:MAG TPA: MarR family transcriptional regulator [Candidatus Agathobaculum merdavium]|nr:MarR family transcriptional regulator [Candidatus Agathobaculum merdavium]